MQSKELLIEFSKMLRFKWLTLQTSYLEIFIAYTLPSGTR